MATTSRHPGHGNKVRLIGGEYRRLQLHFPDAAGLRPTPDRVRETLFNWLGQDLTGMTCLDAFAGSGALGFEAASRNASRVVMLESGHAAAESLRANRDRLKASRVEIHEADALRWMRCCDERFDLILLDPPFAGNMMEQVLPLAIHLLNPQAWLYVEQAERVVVPDGFIMHREGTAGQSHFALFKAA